VPDVAGPFDTASYGQAPWFRDRGPLEPSAVMGTPSATAAGGELGLTAAGFGLTMSLGRAHVRGASYERTGSAWTDTVPANTSGLGPRNDLVVLRRNLVAKTVVPTRIQGTAAASPVDPAVTQVEDGTWDLPLFRVVAPPSSGTPLAITDLRKWVDPDTGSVVTAWIDFPVVAGGYFDHYAATTQQAVNGVPKVQLRQEDKRVKLRGVAYAANSAGAGGVYTAAGGFPAIFRPALPVPIMVPANVGGGYSLYRLDVGSNGTLYVASATIPAGTYFFLNGLGWEL